MAANITNDQIIDQIKQMTALELKNLVSAIEETFGVTAVAAAAGPAVATATEADDQPKVVSLYLTAPGPAKLAIIKKIKEITGKELKDAKDIADKATEAAPQLLVKDLDVEKAEALKKEIETTGCTIVLK